MLKRLSSDGSDDVRPSSRARPTKNAVRTLMPIKPANPRVTLRKPKSFALLKSCCKMLAMTYTSSAPQCAARPSRSLVRARQSWRALTSTASIVTLFFSVSAIAAGLNDTGQTLCYDASNVGVPCSAAVGGDGGVNPRQDGRYGRDAAAGAGRLSKIGAGSAGFDYTKIANDGSTLPASATLGSGPTDWACTKDNVTGLIWEVKTTSGLRSSAHTYSWYSTDAATNGGVAGDVGTNTCGGTLSGYSNQCNTKNYAAAVNASGLCGASDWYLPSMRELRSIFYVGAGVIPSVDSAYFPNTALVGYFTRTTQAASPAYASLIHFGGGYSFGYVKSGGSNAVRLVRRGP